MAPGWAALCFSARASARNSSDGDGVEGRQAQKASCSELCGWIGTEKSLTAPTKVGPKAQADQIHHQEQKRPAQHPLVGADLFCTRVTAAER